MTDRTIYGYIRLGIAVASLVSLVARYIWALGFGAFTGVNYFGYLTIHSNAMFMVVMFVAAVMALKRSVDPQWLTTLRAMTLTMTVTSGFVFAIIMYVGSASGQPLDVDWSDDLMHFILPPIALIEWIASPGRGRAQWRTIPWALGYVVVWGILTLVRGAFVGWYPYFFLDPKEVSLFMEVGLCAVALAFFAVIASAIIGLSTKTPLVLYLEEVSLRPRSVRAVPVRT